MSLSRKIKICHDLMQQALEVIESKKQVQDEWLIGVVKQNLSLLNGIMDDKVEQTTELENMSDELLRSNIEIYFQVMGNSQKVQKTKMTKEQVIKILSEKLQEENPDNILEMNINEWMQQNNIQLKQNE